MDIPTVTGTTQGSGAPASSAGARVASDYETFLKMLTAQIRNQDPLNPIQSSDYAVQLATFSGVEQQVKTNGLLESLVAQMGLSGLAGLAGWVGRDALVAGPVAFDGQTPVRLSVPASPGADQAILVARDATGADVLRLPVSVAGGEVSWTGTRADGSALSPGRYSFRVEPFRGGEPAGTAADVAGYRRIVEVRADAAGGVVVLADGDSVAASSVRGLREAALP